MDEQTIRDLQRTLPWGAHNYNEAFRARTDPQRDAGHAMLHVTKALGRLATATLASPSVMGERVPRHAADVLICALRLGNTYPVVGIDAAAARARHAPAAGLAATVASGPKGPLLDMMAAAGAMADVLDEFDHGSDVPMSVATAHAADAGVALGLLLEALDRFAAAWGLDLEAAVRARLDEKFAPTASAPSPPSPSGPGHAGA